MNTECHMLDPRLSITFGVALGTGFWERLGLGGVNLSCHFLRRRRPPGAPVAHGESHPRSLQAGEAEGRAPVQHLLPGLRQHQQEGLLWWYEQKEPHLIDPSYKC